MSLKREMKTALDAVRQVATVPYPLHVQHGRRHLECELLAVDAIGVSLEQLSMRTDELSGASMERLKEISKGLSNRLTYLMEPISPIEFDADGCTVQLRSNPPQKDDDGTSYYELLVRAGGELSLVRYQKPPGGQRQRIAANVTREVLVRLAGDFDSALD